MLNERARVSVDVATPFQRVTIADLPDYGRCLFLDGDLQSAEIDQNAYHAALVEPAFRFNPNIHTALVLGGGEGATARKILNHQGVEKVTMVDIDEQLVTICEQHLPEWHQGAFADKRLSVTYQDASEFVQKPAEQYDLIVWDLTDPYRWQDNNPTPSTGLYTPQTFELLKQHLTENGLLSVEYGFRNKRLMAPLLKGWKQLVRRDMNLPSFEEKWIFTVLQKPESN